jgi:signal transduction histidine kinase
MTTTIDSIKKLTPLQWIFRRVDSGPDEDRLEQGQARNRIGNLVIICVYTLLVSLLFSPTNTVEPWAIAVLAYYIFYTPVALLTVFLTKRFPGNYPTRRILTMANDYVALAYAIVVGCTLMLPLYAMIVWVTMGNGARFGIRYLMIAGAMAQITLLAIFVLTPYWQEDPIVAVTLSITAFVLPLYARSLVQGKEDARRAAEEANLAKSRFLAQASHDLRQPVHAIGLFLNNLKQTGLAQNQTVIVDRIDRSLQGVSGLFRSLLDISTLDSGGVAPQFQPVSIAQLFSELEQQNQENVDWLETNLKFLTTSQTVATDGALLTTIIQNLISNAIKYAPGRAIRVGCRRSGSTLSILVCDCGDGIENQHIPYLFDEFYQVRNLGDADKQGVGLGLAIVKRLATLLRLEVTITSRIGHGTTVKIDGLEICEAAASGTGSYVAHNYAAPLLGMRILLVEDDMDVLDATADMLRSWGCHVQPYAGVPNAPEPCDLVITDFDIGGGATGIECIAAVRRAQSETLPVIVMTGHDEVRIGDMLNDPDIPILKKPVRAAELRSAISTMRVLHKLAA